MISILNKEDCCGCGACKAVCPLGIIKMKQDEEGFLYPEIKKIPNIRQAKIRVTKPITENMSTFEVDFAVEKLGWSAPHTSDTWEIRAFGNLATRNGDLPGYFLP
jgi:ferredoxin